MITVANETNSPFKTVNFSKCPASANFNFLQTSYFRPDYLKFLFL